jgi:transglutaminase-like putative cysteine protease
MRFKIIHETIYEFNKPVFFEPHYFRFKPKEVPNIAIESFFLNISPNPSGISEQLDAENNTLHFCWFEGLHKSFKIHSETILNSADYNPFNILIYPMEFNTLPFSYSELDAELLHASLNGTTIGPELAAFIRNILASKNNTLSFLTELNTCIHNDFIVESREEGVPMVPDKTFRIKKGSCRDLAWMMIQMLRTLGIATKFVSGYYYVDIENPQFELHAWVEVYLPGAGWIGFDPSNGVVASHAHIAVATSSHYQNTMPVSGTIRGDASSELKTNLSIAVLE